MENLDAFLQEMTALAIKHGIGIAGNPELFVMDWEDRACQYGCDGDSRLTFYEAANGAVT